MMKKQHLILNFWPVEIGLGRRKLFRFYLWTQCVHCSRVSGPATSQPLRHGLYSRKALDINIVDMYGTNSGQNHVLFWTSLKRVKKPPKSTYASWVGQTSTFRVAFRCTGKFHNTHVLPLICICSSKELTVLLFTSFYDFSYYASQATYCDHTHKKPHFWSGLNRANWRGGE